LCAYPLGLSHLCPSCQSAHENAQRQETKERKGRPITQITLALDALYPIQFMCNGVVV